MTIHGCEVIIGEFYWGPMRCGAIAHYAVRVDGVLVRLCKEHERKWRGQ